MLPLAPNFLHIHFPGSYSQCFLFPFCLRWTFKLQLSASSSRKLSWICPILNLNQTFLACVSKPLITPLKHLSQFAASHNLQRVCPLQQQSPNVLAPGTGFVEDNFSMDGEGDGFEMIQVHYTYCEFYF